MGSLLKWLVLSTLAGAVAGLGAVVFLKGLHSAVDQMARITPGWRLALLPVMGGLSGWIVWRFAPQAAGHGTEAVIAAVHERDGDIPFRVVPVKALATIVSLAGGGSAGKEGPCTQIGSGLASALARLLRLSPADRRRLAICGIGAGFTALFGTPLGGAIFAIEVLFGGALLYEILFPSLVAGFTAYQVSQWFHVDYLRPSAPVTAGSGELVFLKALVLGAFLGLVALALIEALEAAERFFHRLPLPAPVRPVVGGVVLAALAVVAGTEYLGMGIETMEEAVAGAALAPAAFLWKLVFTAVTLGSGWSGGVMLPIFFIGAAAGSWAAPLLGLDRAAGAAMGLSALLAGATNAPIASSVIAVEMFGPEVGVYAAAACLASFIMSGHRSVYPSQVLVMSKTAALRVPIRRPAGEVEGQVRLSAGLLRWIAKWRRHARHLRRPHSRPGGGGRPASHGSAL
ncbi:MAG TPA: chloride channel protein [Limnochordales bacterium]